MNHIDNHSSQIQTTRAHINLVFAISPLMSALSTSTNDSREKAQKKKKRKQRAQPNDQKLKKAKTGSFKMSKT
jgi:UDP-N-acetylglucosamine transferase subunit ALG13